MTRERRQTWQRCGSVMIMAALAFSSVVFLATAMHVVTAFAPSSQTSVRCTGYKNLVTPSTQPEHRCNGRSLSTTTSLSFFGNSNSNNNDGDDNGIAGNTAAAASSPEAAVWSPGLRKIIAGFAGLGALETGYLTYAKLVQGSAPSLFCGSSQTAASSCDRVLNGPYSNLPFFETVPLAALGCLAYLSVVGLALGPLAGGGGSSGGGTNGETTAVGGDRSNRILLTALTTAMGTFSIFLMTLLFGVLQTSCPYCLFSAADSFLLTNLALIGGCLPEGAVAEDGSGRDTTGGRTVAAGFAGAVVGAVLLFGTGSIGAVNSNTMGGGGGGSSTSSTLLATTISGGNQQQPQEMLLYAPPEITTESSDRALAIAKSLRDLDAKMYGAHWCSHCYDQKQALGRQVFDKQTGFIEYVECSKDGINSRTKVCKAKEIPGYPTWEISGKLYPGEQNLEELEDLIRDIRSGGEP